MATVIDYRTALELLHEIALEHPDYIYDRVLSNDYGCLYAVELDTDHGTGYVPSCLVGHLLFTLDDRGGRTMMGAYVLADQVSALALAHYDEGTAAGDVAASVSCYATLDLEFTVAARRLLTGVQELQDAGVPWGEAIGYATGVTVPTDELAADIVFTIAEDTDANDLAKALLTAT